MAGKKRSSRAEKTKEPLAATESGNFSDWAKSIAVAVVIFVVIRTFVMQTFVIISGSMESALKVGDMIVAYRLAVGPRIPGTRFHLPGYDEPRRGDVMIFDPHHEEDLMLVKRIAGLPGDTLAMRNGQLIVNRLAVEEPWTQPSERDDRIDAALAWQKELLTADVELKDYQPTLHNWGPIVVPEGHYFMLGDNRDASLDSRYWGPLEGWRLEARAAFVYFSYNRQSYRPFPAIREVRWSRVARSVTTLTERASERLGATASAGGA